MASRVSDAISLMSAAGVVTEIDVSECRLGSGGGGGDTVALFRALAGSTRAIALDTHRTAYDAPIMVDPGLLSRARAGCIMGPAAVTALADVLKANSRARTLDLSGNASAAAVARDDTASARECACMGGRGCAATRAACAGPRRRSRRGLHPPPPTADADAASTVAVAAAAAAADACKAPAYPPVMRGGEIPS